MCAIFGVLDYKGNLTATQRLQMVKALSIAAEVRGTDATGICRVSFLLEGVSRKHPFSRSRMSNSRK